MPSCRRIGILRPYFRTLTKPLVSFDLRRYSPSYMLTATDFYRYLQCPHWPYWERFGDPAERRSLTEFEEQRLADGLDHEARVVAKIYGDSTEVSAASPAEGIAATRILMEQGVPVIYQGWLSDGEWLGRPDILERHEGESALGAWYYVPVDVKRAHELKKEHMFQLIMYALLLEKVQQRFPAHPAILNGDGERLEFDPQEYMAEFREVALKLERVVAGERPEPVYRKSCEDTSPWGKACFRLAKEHDDVALLFNVEISKLTFLREHGIRTIYEAADMDPATLEGQAPGMTLRALQSIQRQARSLVDQSVIIKKPWMHETTGTEIHFDIESHPMTDTDYLYGFWIRDEAYPEGKSVFFLADTPEEEEKMWKEFLAWLPTLPAEYTVYHYATYEATRIRVLAKRYGDEENPWLLRFADRLFDLKEAAREYGVYPLYFYSLKNICMFLGFAWTSEVKSGGASIGAYERWLSTHDRSVLDDLVQYNRDDVRATAYLLAWLNQYARQEGVYPKPYPWQSAV